ncbi:hypothetical protein L228DRAFT_153868 [Xylona heveae TC161]|uniref:Uncharacterized protein n=1 Tax=Xylona heveae (strain CBS 132557 / TC161) TaxID=1328760 RepID=A0A165FWJ8_XYLHT|nr:hypothetical protein L228DRAFT_153868 [Xylona heveae TC161]KZF21470.1 hypothetical protein L228DRAFT_153868 [Xylona heveae TC161]
MPEKPHYDWSQSVYVSITTIASCCAWHVILRSEQMLFTQLTYVCSPFTFQIDKNLILSALIRGGVRAVVCMGQRCFEDEGKANH